MNENYKLFRDKAFSALTGLAKEFPEYSDAKMLVASSEASASLKQNTVYKSIDTSWIDAIEAALPALDIIIRNPAVAIEDVDEILPVEISRHITEKSIKHLAQHTNLILDVKDDEVTPQKILNVYHDETYLTYENKFVNTLLARLSAFVDKRYKVLSDTVGVERNYKFDYKTEFEHYPEDGGSRNSARISLSIELTSPLDVKGSEPNIDDTNAEINDQYMRAISRIKRINMALIDYRSSAFAQKMGRVYIRPPVIRTNAILKNKNLKECLTLWEYIETFDKVGYTLRYDEYREMPSHHYISDLYSSIAMQYTDFYNGVAEENNRLLSKKHLFDIDPDFMTDEEREELEDYLVYDSEYRKTVPVSRLMNNRKKLSEDEKRIHTAIIVALRADEILNADLLEKEAEARRLAREKRLAEEEERRRREEERLRLEEELRRLEEEARIAAMAPVEIRYRRSFMSRLIQSEDKIKDYYTAIKNRLLSYKGVTSKVSWGCETFKKKRDHIAKIDVKGKNLYVYLALDPKDFAESKYFFTNIEDKKPETPMLIKVKSDRAKKHALELIDILALKLSLVLTESEYVYYGMPYEDNDTLIDKGLIKLILPPGVVLVDGMPMVKAKLDLLDEYKKKLKELPVPNIQEEPQETLSENNDISIIAAPIDPIEIRYRRSFMSRLIQSEDNIKEYYGDIKNHLLSYKGVKSKISWGCETFKSLRIHIVKMDIKGKALYVYFALDPKEFADSKYFFSDLSEKKPENPMLLKVKSDRGRKHAFELIDILMQKIGLEIKSDYISENYYLPFEENETLIERRLIKVILPAGVILEEGMETVKSDLVILEEYKNKSKEELSGEETVTEEEQTPQENEKYSFEEALLKDNVDVSSDGLLEDSEENLGPVAIRYRRSFMSRLIQSDEEIQCYYSAIKNRLLSYKGVKSKISWGCETFKSLRIHIVKMDIKGKALYVYFAMDPQEFAESKYFFTNVRDKKPENPMLLKVKSRRGQKHAIELVDIIMQKIGLEITDKDPIDYRLPFEDNDSLIEKGLIKVILPTGVKLEEGMETVKINIDELLALKEVFVPSGSLEEEAEAIHPIKVSEADIEMSEESEIMRNTDTVTYIEALLDEFSDDIIEKYIDIILDYADPAKKLIIGDSGIPVSNRKDAGELNKELAFAGEENEHTLATIPYARDRYLLLPRRKKKAALAAALKLFEYKNIKDLLSYLEKREFSSKKVLNKVAKLVKRKKSKKKALIKDGYLPIETAGEP